MSGGYFEYRNDNLKTDIFGYEFYADYGVDGFKNQNVPNVFEDREISELVADVFDLIHSFDWYKSGDTCKDSYLKDKKKFKNKWFFNRGVRVKTIVDNAIQQVKEELYETYCIKEGDDNGTREEL